MGCVLMWFILLFHLVLTKELSRLNLTHFEKDLTNQTNDVIKLHSNISNYNDTYHQSNNISNGGYNNTLFNNSESLKYNQTNHSKNFSNQNNPLEFTSTELKSKFQAHTNKQYDNPNAKQPNMVAITLNEKSDFFRRFDVVRVGTNEDSISCERLLKDICKINHKNQIVTLIKSIEWRKYVSHLVNDHPSYLPHTDENHEMDLKVTNLPYENKGGVTSSDNITGQEEEGVSSTDDVIYYTFLGHDVNEDHQFDMIEMTSLLIHLQMIFGTEPMYSDGELEAVFDPLLLDFDWDKNGQLSYSEFRRMTLD